MGILSVDLWGLWAGCFALLVSVVVSLQGSEPWIPNKLSLGALVLGLAASLLATLLLLPTRGGGLLASLAGIVAAFLFLLPLYLRGGYNAGAIKMQMAFAAWVGCSLDPPRTCLIVFLCTLAAISIYGLLFVISKRIKPLPRLLHSQPVMLGGALLGLAVAWFMRSI